MPNFDEIMNNKDNKLYRVQIVEVNPETKEEKELHNGLHSSVTMVADDAEDDNRMCEIVLNDNLHGIATKLASGRKLKSAVRLAHMYMSMVDDRMSDMEGLLADALMKGGIQ